MPTSTPFTCVGSGVIAIGFGTLAKYRLLPFLKNETILSGGKQIRTVEFAANLSTMFYIFGVVAVVLGFILLFNLSEERKRKIAQLPRWKRFLVWPIDRHIAPKN